MATGVCYPIFEMNPSLTALKYAESNLAFVEPNIIYPVRKLNVFSPMEFYLSLECYTNRVDLLEDALQQSYTENTAPLYKIFVCKKTPCVVKDKDIDQFYRCQINETNGENEAIVKFVDYGNTSSVRFSEIKPLWKNFSDIPPLAMKCRLKDVDSRRLEWSSIDKFRHVMMEFNEFDAEFQKSTLPNYDGFDVVLYKQSKDNEQRVDLRKIFSKFIFFKNSPSKYGSAATSDESKDEYETS